MRIAHFTESYLPVINGVSTSVQGLCRELTRMGEQPVVYAPQFIGYTEPEEPFPVCRVPSWRTPLNPENPFAYPPIFGLPKVLRATSFDLVHTHHPFGIGLQASKLAHQLRVPLVATFHTLYMEYGHYVPFLPRWLVVRGVSWYLHRYYAQCRAVLVPSSEAGRRLTDIGVPKERLHVVPTGVPDAPTVSAAQIGQIRELYDLPVGTPVILFVGRMAKEKNLTLLIEAFSRLVRLPGRASKAVLVLVGDGPDRSGCEQLVEYYDLEDKVRFTGFKQHSEIAPFYALATVFAFPSASETQGVVLCEAQSYGLPCVAVQGGGAPEFVRNGIDALVVPSATDAFVNSLATLLTNDELRTAFAFAARRTPLRLTPEEVVQKIVSIYSALL